VDFKNILMASALLLSGHSYNVEAKITKERLDAAEARSEGEASNYEGVKLSQAIWTKDNELIFSLESPGGKAEIKRLKAAQGVIEKAKATDLSAMPEDWPQGMWIGGQPGPDKIPSPNGQFLVSSDSRNLTLTETKSGKQQPLTIDGKEDYRYGDAILMAWSGQIGAQMLNYKAPPAVIWSPDSSRFISYVVDARDVRRKPFVYLTKDKSGTPDFKVLNAIQPMHGDKNITTVHFLIFDALAKKMIKIELPLKFQDYSDPLRTGAVKWSDDGKSLYISFSDIAKTDYRVFKIDPETGSHTVIYEEKGRFRGHFSHIFPRLHNQSILIASDRDGSRALYNHDAATGRLLNRISQGKLHVEALHGAKDGWVYFSASKLDDISDPYQYNLFRARLDGSSQQQLTTESGNHVFIPSPALDYFVVSRSQLNAPTTHIVIDNTGRIIKPLALPKLKPGTQLPERVSGLARDNKTRIWGTLYKPTDFDASKRYPIIHHVHGTAGFLEAPTTLDSWYSNQYQALADLGFLVMAVEGMGGTGRTTEFLNVAYETGHQCGGILENVLLMKQLAKSRPYIDLSRVGIMGISQGGNCSSRAIFEYPDDFHVAVSQSGNHDSRFNHPGEIMEYVGYLEGRPNAMNNQDNASLAHQLKGKILFTHGLMDDDVPAQTTFHVIEALIAANKHYDLMVMPSERHDASGQPYHRRAVWSYFVEHLLGEKLSAFDNQK
jgi:dipeptidyl-peptidase 4